MQKKRFIVDTNVFIAAFKSGYTATTKLLQKLLSDPGVDLIVDDILLVEYEKWLNQLSSKLPSIKDQAETLYYLIKAKAVKVRPEKVDIETVKPHMPKSEYADTYHAAACLRADSILITNDKDFNNIRKLKIIKVWSITEALERLKIL